MMTAAQIRQSFLDFFREKQHTIVPSASLLPQSPGLLFTNAGMNQFVPYFLGTQQCPYVPGRAADTQKCIRAGGKHNDLEDVGYDTYHHTMFEMLGNWSFGDYFKREAIEWAWELFVDRWGMPANRLYATVYAPDKSKGDPGEFDNEAWNVWASLFRSKGLDPHVHIVHGNVKDNFWMMGDTGPCGPCSELHVDLTPEGDTRGSLVNQSSDMCIEIWNLVFIQYNAEADGSFFDLPARHVDTGMGFERACSIIQNTKGFSDFSKRPSNYATDVFTPIFAKLEELSGKTYVDVYPSVDNRSDMSEELQQAIAFRVIADHIRTLSFSIADGILPGNAGRNYVLRRILRRAVRYGRKLGFSGDKPFLSLLVDVLVENFAAVFPELAQRAQVIKDTLLREENSFNESLDRGLELFANYLQANAGSSRIDAEFAFQLYDTYGFPIDLTQLLAQERGLQVDMDGFNRLMEMQRQRARAARKSTLVRALDVSSNSRTEFVGYQQLELSAPIIEVIAQQDLSYVIFDKSVFYAEMGGQLADEGHLILQDGSELEVEGVVQLGEARALLLANHPGLQVGATAVQRVDATRRAAINAHHTATHLLHWALHRVAGSDAVQQGSLVEPGRLRFDFSSGALSKEQIEQIEQLVNEQVKAALPVYIKQVPFSQVQGNANIMQFFGDKYAEEVRVVQIGGDADSFDGVSMELCGGTHVQNTKDIGFFKIRSEAAIAAGVRRIEASCDVAAWDYLREELLKAQEQAEQFIAKIKECNARLSSCGQSPEPIGEFPHIMFGMLLEHNDVQKINDLLGSYFQYVQSLQQAGIEASKRLKKFATQQAARQADAALVEVIEAGKDAVVDFLADAELLGEVLNGLKKKDFAQSAFVLVDDGEKLHCGVYCGSQAQAAGQQAGKLLQALLARFGGKGGGRADNARGALVDRACKQQLLDAAKQALGI